MTADSVVNAARMGMSAIALRVEAGGRFGSGHLIRSLALAEELARVRPVRFIVSSSTAGMELIRRHRFPLDVVDTIDGEEATHQTVRAMRAANVDILVTDFDGIDTRYLSSLRAELPAMRLVCIDDRSVPPDLPDLLVRPHAVEAYWPNAGPRVLVGPRYWILRRAFDELPAPRAKVPTTARRVLVMLGGAAPGAVLAALIRELAALEASVELDVIAGALGDGLPEVHDAMGTLGNRGRLHIDSPVLPELMARADLAIASAGYSLYELCALGTPTLAIALVDHQRTTLDALERRGCVEAARLSRTSHFEGLPAQVSALVDDAAKRASLSSAGSAMVDRLGRRRVVARILGRVQDD
jgi:UDP-2,4-diacetamido-2,4,6-trideoxy-beta-L-altropyranose hydrolase